MLELVELGLETFGERGARCTATTDRPDLTSPFRFPRRSGHEVSGRDFWGAATIGAR
jgi:hypothetical protein